jgi:hypothetical protein
MEQSRAESGSSAQVAEAKAKNRQSRRRQAMRVRRNHSVVRQMAVRRPEMTAMTICVAPSRKNVVAAPS